MIEDVAPTFSFGNEIVNIFQVGVMIVAADIIRQLLLSENKRRERFHPQRTHWESTALYYASSTHDARQLGPNNPPILLPLLLPLYEKPTASSVTNLFEEFTDGLAAGTTSAAQNSASSGGGGGQKIKYWHLINIGARD
jgi:hypothetical protein